MAGKKTADETQEKVVAKSSRDWSYHDTYCDLVHDIALAIGKANGHEDPEGYAIQVMANFKE